MGTGGAAHLAGRNPNLPEAIRNRPGLDEGQRLPGQPRALWHHRTEPAQAAGQGPQAVSRHQLLRAAGADL